MREFEFIRPRADGYMPKAPDLDGNWVEILDVTTASPAAQATCAFYWDLALRLNELQMERNMRQAQSAAEAIDVVRRMSNIPPRDELEEIRGNHVKAEQIRDQWRDSGLHGGAA